MIRILVCGEGEGDVGNDQIWDANAQVFVGTDGWLQIFLKKLLGHKLLIERRSRRDLILLPRDRKKYRPLPKGHGAKALVAKIIATIEDFDLVIFMADADSNVESEWRKKRLEILEGFEKFESKVAALACVPKATSESWLLADSSAWQRIGLENAAVLPRKPENIWGKRNDPEANHPHQLFGRACRQVGVSDSQEVRVELATAINLDVLKKVCPVSFGAFVSDLSKTEITPKECDCGQECCVD